MSLCSLQHNIHKNVLFCHATLELAKKKEKKKLRTDKVTLFWKQLLSHYWFFLYMCITITTSQGFSQGFENNLNPASHTLLTYVCFWSTCQLSLSLSLLLIHSSPALMSGLALVINAIQQVFAKTNLSTLYNRTEALLALQALCRGSIHRRVLNKTALITDKTGRVALSFLSS